MEAVAITSAVGLGKGLLSAAIGDMYLFLKGSAHKDHLEQVLSKLDIKAEIDVVQALLDDLSTHDECKAVRVASGHVKETVDAIHGELKKIHDELEYHKTRYFNKWRNAQYEPHLDQLCAHRKQLRKRHKLLFAVLSVQNAVHE